MPRATLPRSPGSRLTPTGAPVWLLTLISLAFVAGPASAQPARLSRLAVDEPEIHFKSNGRSGACDVLAFSHDGSRLFAVGEDKVVHRWAVGPATLRNEPPLHWNTFREQRGSIYALAMSDPKDPLPKIAIAGNGKLNADVALFHPGTGQFLGAISPFFARSTDPYYGARFVIWALAFSPAGDRLAIGDGAGNVWECPLVGGRPSSEKVALARKGDPQVQNDSRILWVGYLPGGQLAFASRDGRVSVAAGGKETLLFDWKFGERVDQVVTSGDGRWLAARPARDTAKGCDVKVRLLAGGGERSVHFPYGHYPDEIALDKTGSRLAVGLSVFPVVDRRSQKQHFAVELPGKVAIYELAPGGPREFTTVPVPARPDRIAFHPDGKLLATADSLDHGTTLWSLDEKGLRSLGRDVGIGAQLWAVGMTPDGRHLCFKTRRNPNPTHPNDRADPNAPWVTFDMGEAPRGWANTQMVPEAPKSSLGGWTVRTHDGMGYDDLTWYVVEPGGRTRHKLPLDPLRDDAPRCYTFLPGVRAGTVRLAVGHAWGASVFELSPGTQPSRVRRFNGHAGYVTAIAPTLGGKGLVTCGRDQAIALWNLADFPSEPLLGASFVQRPGGIFVNAVDVGSPAQEAGLSAGDRVLQFMRGDSPDPVPQARWLQEFKNPSPLREMLWWVDRPGMGKNVDNRVKTSLLHRPAARFLPMTNGEWVLYTYRQCYYDCSPNGDHFIEWLISKNQPDRAPDVLPVEQFAKYLNKPAKVGEVVKLLARESARPILPDLFPPTLTIKGDAALTKPGQNVKVTVDFVPQPRQDGATNPVARIELWLNGHQPVLPDAGQDGKFPAKVPGQITFTVRSTDLRTGPNTLQAVGIGADDPGTGLGSGAGKSAVLSLNHQGPPVRRRLYAVVVGLADYRALDASGKQDLPGTRLDTRRLKAVWEVVQKTGGYVTDETTEVVRLQDREVTKARIIKEIKRIGAQARPDDLFVLCLCGHGATFDPGGKLIEDGSNGDWYYAIPHLDATASLKPQDLGRPKQFEAFLKDAEVLKAVSNPDFRPTPLLLLDCCHSGVAARKGDLQASARNSQRSLTSNGFGPVVIAACAPNQKSWESPRALPKGILQLAPETKEKADDNIIAGVFSYTVYRTLHEGVVAVEKKATGKVSVTEFFEAVERGTQEEARNVKDQFGQTPIQTPQISPSKERLKDLILVARPLPRTLTPKKTP